METQGSVENGRQLIYDLDTAASGHGGYGCCDTGVDFATLLALSAGMPHFYT